MPIPAGAVSTGTVQFQIDGTNFGNPITLVGGVATSSADSSLPVGADTITAIYSGDTNFITSNNSVTQTVFQYTTTTSVTSTANPSVSGQPVTFTATVAANTSGAVPTGTVHSRSTARTSAVPYPGGRRFHQQCRLLALGGDPHDRGHLQRRALITSNNTLTQTVSHDTTTTTLSSTVGQAGPILYVSEFISGNIETFNTTATNPPPTTFASLGQNGPLGLALDASDNLYAGIFNYSVSPFVSMIEKFTPGGVGGVLPRQV